MKKSKFRKSKFHEAKFRKGTWNGSYTVEAALVLPLVFFILAAFLLLSFYIHDCALLQGIACETAAGVSCQGTKKERTRMLSEKEKLADASRFLGGRDLSGQQNVSKKEVQVKKHAVYPVVGFTARFFSGSSMDVDANMQMKIHDPADSIRKIIGAAHLLTGGEN